MKRDDEFSRDSMYKVFIQKVVIEYKMQKKKKNLPKGERKNIFHQPLKIEKSKSGCTK